MYCKICGTENPDEALYCKNCGNPMVEKKEVINCPHCEQENDKESVFCKKCGKELVCDEDDVVEKPKETKVNEAKRGLLSLGLLGLFVGAPLMGGAFGIIIAFFSNDKEGIFAGVFVACGVALISLYTIIIFLLAKQINLKHGEYLLMQELTEGNIIYLTNKRIISKWVNKTEFEFNVRSKDIDIQLWISTFGNKKGIIITQKYETPIKIKLETPDKWYDKIMELRNS